MCHLWIVNSTKLVWVSSTAATTASQVLMLAQDKLLRSECIPMAIFRRVCGPPPTTQTHNRHPMAGRFPVMLI